MLWQYFEQALWLCIARAFGGAGASQSEEK
jgi:hypothetical protein